MRWYVFCVCVEGEGVVAGSYGEGGRVGYSVFEGWGGMGIA